MTLDRASSISIYKLVHSEHPVFRFVAPSLVDCVTNAEVVAFLRNMADEIEKPIPDNDLPF